MVCKKHFKIVIDPKIDLEKDCRNQMQHYLSKKARELAKTSHPNCEIFCSICGDTEFESDTFHQMTKREYICGDCKLIQEHMS